MFLYPLTNVNITAGTHIINKRVKPIFYLNFSVLSRHLKGFFHCTIISKKLIPSA